MEWPHPVMTFSIEGKMYALPLSKIKKVINSRSLSFIPVQVNLPSLYGYTKDNNIMIPLINIRLLFLKIVENPTYETSILLTELNSYLVGLQCDAVHAVITPSTSLTTLPDPLLVEAKDYFSGVFLHEGEIFLLFNTETLFRPGDIALMQETSEIYKDIEMTTEQKD